MEEFILYLRLLEHSKSISWCAVHIGTYCGAKQRDITFQVVDVNGGGVGTVPVMESFFDKQYGTPIASAYNSCNRTQIYPTGCFATDRGTGGKFVDTLRVGCPTVSGDCGSSEFLSRWSWCPSGRSPVALSTNTYYVRRDSILVNGSPRFAAGTQLY